MQLPLNQGCVLDERLANCRTAELATRIAFTSAPGVLCSLRGCWRGVCALLWRVQRRAGPRVLAGSGEVGSPVAGDRAAHGDPGPPGTLRTPAAARAWLGEAAG